MAGQHDDMVAAASLIECLCPKHEVAHQGYDSDPLRRQIRRQEAEAVIPALKGVRRRRYDKTEFELRNLVELYSNRLKRHRRIAKLYEKMARYDLGFVQLAVLWLLV